jgi:hypothetical protein
MDQLEKFSHLFTSSFQISNASSDILPPPATPPVSDMPNPILIESAAKAGASIIATLAASTPVVRALMLDDKSVRHIESIDPITAFSFPATWTPARDDGERCFKPASPVIVGPLQQGYIA